MPELHLSALEQLSTVGSPLRVGVSSNKGKHTNELLLGLVCASEDLIKLGASLPPIEYIWRDDGRNPQRAASVAAEYCKMGVQYVIGHLSASASLSASKIYQKNKVCFIAPATSHPDLTRNVSLTIFRVCGKDDSQGEFIRHCVNRIVPNAAITIIAQDNAYGLALSAAVSVDKAGSTHSIVVPEKASARLKAKQLQRIKERSLDYPDQTIVLCGVHEITGQLVRQLREAGIEDVIFVGDDALIHDFTVLCGAYSDNVYVVGLAPVQSKQFVQLRADLSSRYINQVGVSPGAYFETSYWSAYILLSTLAEKNSVACSTEVADAIRSKMWSTSMGDIRFDERGDAHGLKWSLFAIDETTFEPAFSVAQC